MTDWFNTFDENLWLKGDDTGGDDAQYLLRVLGLQPGMRVLDVPCGAGRVAVHLARAGCRLSGIDFTPNFIARARQRFTEADLTGDFRVLDMRLLDERNVYDAVINWGGSFGFFTDDANLDVLQRMMAALKPGGRLLIDQPNREWLLRHFQPVMPLKGGQVENRWQSTANRVDTVWYHEGAERVNTSSMRLYSPAQFRRLFTRAGLSWEGAYDGKSGNAFTRSSRRVCVVGRKD